MASRELVHRLDRLRGMLFFYGGRGTDSLFRNLAEGPLLVNGPSSPNHWHQCTDMWSLQMDLAELSATLYNTDMLNNIR